jgi:hypothetical protein
MQRAVLSFPGINHFRMEIGAPNKHGEKTAALDALATWRVGSEEFRLECRKTESGDMRIIVNSYDTSGVDQLRGLAESKLLRRVFATLTGIKSIDPDDTEPAADSHSSVEGKLASPIQIEHLPAQAESVSESSIDAAQTPEEESEFGGYVYNFANAEQVLYFIDCCCQKIEDTKTIDAAGKMAKQCLDDLQQTDWSERAKTYAIAQMMERKPTAFARLRGLGG